VNLIRALRQRMAQSGNTPKVPLSPSVTFTSESTGQWYSPVLLSASTIGRLAVHSSIGRDVASIVSRLETDDYSQFVESYCKFGREQLGDEWQFADILTVLTAAARLVKPTTYLEIGVRRGRSLAVVSAAAPDCKLVGFDMWVPGYAGMDNPGEEFIRKLITDGSHRGSLELVSGDSHLTVPKYFKDHPDVYFDLITVDGDHSEAGAIEDLRKVIPRLKLGGVLVFDDITNPGHPELKRVWEKVIVADQRFSTWAFEELGFGVGVAVRTTQ
jgi:predicted O-methyltransferase YrrM